MKIKNFRQLDNSDCGPACLCTIANYYGKELSLSYVAAKSYKKKTGTSLLNLKDSAEELGFQCIGVHTTLQRLVEMNAFPYIVFINQNHYVVLHKVTVNKCHVADPSKGLLVYRKEAFLKSWTSGNEEINENNKGIALLLKPTDKFYELEEVKDKGIKLVSLFSYILPYKGYLLKIMLGLLIAGLISMSLPFLTQLVVDNGIQNKNITFITLLFVAQMLLIIGQSFNNYIQNWLLLHVTSRISVSLVSGFLSKLMKLRISFFDSRMIGDIIQRINDYERIETFLTGSLISIITIIVSFLIFGSVILKYSFYILLIFLAGSVCYIVWILLLMKKRAIVDYMRFQETAVNYSNIIQIITGIQDIKLNNCERKKRWQWEKTQIKLHEISMSGLKLSQTQKIGGDLIDNMKNIAISFLSATFVINGELSLGMFFAIQFTVGQLNVPLYQSIGIMQSWQDVRLSLKRINEIYGNEEEEDAKTTVDNISPGMDIRFENVSFRYGGINSPFALKNISLVIPHHKVTAIVGYSGSGKTTLLKLLLGYYDPTEGEIALNDIFLRDINKNYWRSKCAIVMQESFIFSDTIEENIGLADDEPDMGRIAKAAEIANVNTFIESLPMKYKTRIGPEGQNLSTGQKQRLLIARAVYKNADYILLDEATNSLDATNEKNIMNNLSKHFHNKTVLIIAHRLSTVKHADNIIVLDKGCIAETGTHEDLIKRKGYYYKLIKDQLELGG